MPVRTIRFWPLSMYGITVINCGQVNVKAVAKFRLALINVSFFESLKDGRAEFTSSLHHLLEQVD